MEALDSIAALTEISDPVLAGLRRCLGDVDRRVQRRAAEVAGSIAGSWKSVAALIGEAQTSPDPRLRWGGAFAASEAAAVSIDTLRIWVDALATSDRDRRWAAHSLIVRWAGVVGEKGLDVVRAAAADRNSGRQKMALYCLRDLASGDAKDEALASAALDAADLEVRLAALATLAATAVTPAQACVDLTRYLRDADPRMCRATAAAMGKLGPSDPVARSALEKAAQSPDSGLRRAAVNALGRG